MGKSIYRYRGLFIYEDKVILDNKNEVDLDISLPILVNKVDDDILDKLISKYESINDEIKLMISEIKYDPNEVDEERFLLNFNNEDINLIKSFGSMLGKTDVDGQMSEINQFVSLLNGQIVTAEEEKNKNSKMYKSLGTIVGLGIVILLF